MPRPSHARGVHITSLLPQSSPPPVFGTQTADLVRLCGTGGHILADVLGIRLVKSPFRGFRVMQASSWTVSDLAKGTLNFLQLFVANAPETSFLCSCVNKLFRKRVIDRMTGK
jgi:hypothetical protein